MNSKTVPEKNDITRRRFCNRVLLASSALALGAGSLKVAGAEQHSVLLDYPPLKITGAESLPAWFVPVFQLSELARCSSARACA